MSNYDDIPDQFTDNIEASSVSDRVYDTMLGIRQPAPVEDIADLALCEPDEARAVLDTLVKMRVIRPMTKDGETRYYRNEQFIQWLRATMLTEEYTQEELDELADDADDEVLRFEALYDVSSPDDLMLPIDNPALQDRMKKDATHWQLIEQTQADIAVAKQLKQSDVTREE